MACGQVTNCQRALGTHGGLWFLQDLSSWLEATAPAQDEWRSVTGTSGKPSVTQTLVPKLPPWSAGSCSAAQPCLSLGQLTLEKGMVPSGTESCSVWGMNPFLLPAPGDPQGTSPAPTQRMPVSPAHVRTQGGVLNTGGVLRMGEQGKDCAGGEDRRGDHKIMEWFGFEGIFKVHLVQPPLE